MVLVNGAEGIGTGWSTKVPQFSPRDICKSLINKIEKGEFREIHPNYKGFQGDIVKNESGTSYTTQGKIELSSNPDLPSTINIT